MDGIGHNLPNSGDLKLRADELLEAVNRVPATLDVNNVGKAADFVKQIGAHAKLIEERRKAAKQPHLDAGKVIDATYSNIADPLLAAKKKVEAKIGDYQRKVADEERRRRDEEARKAAEEAVKLEAAAQTPDALDEAIAAHAEARRAGEAAQVTTAELSRTHGALGAVATVRTTWEFEIENSVLVPREYCLPSEALIRSAIKAGGERAIAGVRIYQRETTVVR